jgi:hypothetical protein
VARTTIRKSQWVAWFGAAAIAFGALMPWASGPFGITASGTSGDGVGTLICGLIIAGVAFRFPRLWAVIIALLAALVAAAAGIYDTVHISTADGLSIGFGLVLTDAGALCCAASSIVALGERRSIAGRNSEP